VQQAFSLATGSLERLQHEPPLKQAPSCDLNGSHDMAVTAGRAYSRDIPNYDALVFTAALAANALARTADLARAHCGRRNRYLQFPIFGPVSGQTDHRAAWQKAHGVIVAPEPLRYRCRICAPSDTGLLNGKRDPAPGYGWMPSKRLGISASQ